MSKIPIFTLAFHLIIANLTIFKKKYIIKTSAFLGIFERFFVIGITMKKLFLGLLTISFVTVSIKAEDRGIKRDSAPTQRPAKRQARQGSDGNPTQGVNLQELIEYFLERRITKGLDLPPGETNHEHK